jgi:hypothetical protein
VLKKEKRMSKKVNIEIDVQSVIDAAQEAFNGPDAQEIADELFERVVDKIESNLDFGDIAREIDLGDIAGEIDISELAKEIDLKELAEQIECNLELNLKELVESVVEQKLGVQLARAETTDELFERVVKNVESNLDLVDIARGLDLGDIAQEIDIRELAEHIELDELAERLADRMQRKLLKDWNVKETVETVVERMLSAQLADMRVSIARLDLERRTLCSEIESLKATLSMFQPLLKLVDVLK